MNQEKIQNQIKPQNMLNYLEGLAFFDGLNLRNTLIVCGSITEDGEAGWSRPHRLIFFDFI